MKVVIVVGTRPQIIKSAILRPALLGQGIDVELIHTGQHYDRVLFGGQIDALKMSGPDADLQIGSDSYGEQIRRGVSRLVPELTSRAPDAVLTIGDSNPALVGSLGAVAAGLPLLHSEAGLRTGETTEPEERNRLMIDSLANRRFCSTSECFGNLASEGLQTDSFITGDLLKDCFDSFGALEQPLPARLGLAPEAYIVLTLHRRRNTYRPTILESIVEALRRKDWPFPIVWPVHPGVKKELRRLNKWRALKKASHLSLIDPLTYPEMMGLVSGSKAIMTDSVGLQVESYLARRPALIIRSQVEYGSLVASGWSTLVAPTRSHLAGLPRLVDDVISNPPRRHDEELFGAGDAAQLMARSLREMLEEAEK